MNSKYSNQDYLKNRKKKSRKRLRENREDQNTKDCKGNYKNPNSNKSNKLQFHRLNLLIIAKIFKKDYQ